MNNDTYQNRRIIWESKWKRILVILASFLFVGLALWTKSPINSFMFWLTIALFGGGGLFMLLQLLNPKNLFVKHDSELGKQIMTEQFQKLQETLGFFTYFDSGFSVETFKGVQTCSWSDISSLFAYKQDLFTTDEIGLDIFLVANTVISVNESTEGWFQFLKKLQVNIPNIPENWEFEIATPAFEVNLTLLFDMQGRNQEDAIKSCYTG